MAFWQRQKRDEQQEPEFRVEHRFGSDFAARGKLPGVTEGSRVPPSQRFREHFLYCTRLPPGRDGGASRGVSPDVQANESFLLRLLAYERKQAYRRLFAAVLFGEPTHRMRLGYYLKGDDRPRYIINDQFNFLLPDVKAFSDQTSLKVLDYCCYLLYYQSKAMLRAELTASETGKTFWYIAIERQLVAIAFGQNRPLNW